VRVRYRVTLDRQAQAFHGGVGRRRVRLMQENNEFLAPQRATQSPSAVRLSLSRQHATTPGHRYRAVVIVNEFEAIQITDCNRKNVACAPGARKLLDEADLGRAPVGKPVSASVMAMLSSSSCCFRSSRICPNQAAEQFHEGTIVGAEIIVPAVRAAG